MGLSPPPCPIRDGEIARRPALHLSAQQPDVPRSGFVAQGGLLVQEEGQPKLIRTIISSTKTLGFPRRYL
jgi:hypothetical protein